MLVAAGALDPRVLVAVGALDPRELAAAGALAPRVLAGLPPALYFLETNKMLFFLSLTAIICGNQRAIPRDPADLAGRVGTVYRGICRSEELLGSILLPQPNTGTSARNGTD